MRFIRLLCIGFVIVVITAIAAIIIHESLNPRNYQDWLAIRLGVASGDLPAHLKCNGHQLVPAGPCARNYWMIELDDGFLDMLVTRLNFRRIRANEIVPVSGFKSPWWWRPEDRHTDDIESLPEAYIRPHRGMDEETILWVDRKNGWIYLTWFRT